MFNLKKRTIRIVCSFLIFNFVFQLVFPVVTMALTSGPTQPDIHGFQPADATDNVSLVTGSFNYTIPVPSVPEYPMAYAYRSGLGMEDEATAFGFGGNCYSGAIARGLQGLPDDVRDGEIVFEMDNENRWGAATGYTGGVSFGEDDMFGLGMGGKEGYDNFSGFWGTTFIGAYANLGQLNVFVGVHSSTDKYQPTLLTQASAGNDFARISAAAMSNGAFSVGLSAGYRGWMTEVASIGKDEKGNAYYGVLESYQYLNPNKRTSAVVPAVMGTDNFGTMTSLDFPIYGGNAHISHYLFQYMNKDVKKRAFGTLYLGEGHYNRGDRVHYADMFVEKENPFPEPEFIFERQSPAHIQRDIFSVSGGGLSGSMQLWNQEYGVVSRSEGKNNTKENLALLVKNERKEVNPWTATTKTVINKDLDIIESLKNSNAAAEFNTDFNPTASHFIDEVKTDLNSSDYKFGANPEFKMRGDMAGNLQITADEWDGKKIKAKNLVFHDSYKPSTDARKFFLGIENYLPAYSFTAPASSGPQTIRNGTNITYTTVGNLLAVAGDEKTKYSRGQNEKLFDSFYCHYTINKTAADLAGKATYVELTSSGYHEEFNLLNHLYNIQGSQQAYFNSLIAGIEIRDKSGMKYIYNLPAFAKESMYTTLLGRGEYAPTQTSWEDYASYYISSNKKRERVKMKEKYLYPYAWNLTAIVGPDYIDYDDIPGPSDGDIGYWVKFKYIKAADNYRWRYPFIGLQHFPNSIHRIEDDRYAFSTGTKEIYYLAEVESASHISKYSYGKRYDGLDARDKSAGSGSNELTGLTPQGDKYVNDICGYSNDIGCYYSNKSSFDDPLEYSEITGNNFQYACTDISLYKKNVSGDNSSLRSNVIASNKKVKSVKFIYDYSICKGVPNNLINDRTRSVDNFVYVKNIPYHKRYAEVIANPGNQTLQNLKIEEGKLTLRKIQEFTYDGNTAVPLPAFDFTYKFDQFPSVEEYNPLYNPKQVDVWGNYSKRSRSEQEEDLAVDNIIKIPYYHHYTEVSKIQADKNAGAFALSSISLPTGGTINVDFEAKDYGFVEGDQPYVTRKIADLQYYELNGVKCTKMKVDVTDLTELNSAADLTSVKGVYVGADLFARAAFFDASKAEVRSRDDLYLTKGESFPITQIDSKFTEDGKTYQWIHVRGGNYPLKSNCLEYVYGITSVKMRTIRESGVLSSINDCQRPERFYDRYKDGDQVKINQSYLHKLFVNFTNLLVSKDRWLDKYETCYGKPCEMIYPHLSFIRTHPYKGKYTGSRVKSITYTDGFNYATIVENGVPKAGRRESSYGTRYRYEQDPGISDYSSGVASCEPNTAKDMTPKNSVTETGTGFMPAPAVYYSRTTVEPLYKTYTGTENKTPRSKGRTTYEFFTPRDIQFKEHFSSMPLDQKGRAKGQFTIMLLTAYYTIRFQLCIPLPLNKQLCSKPITINIPYFIPANTSWIRSDNYYGASYAYVDRQDMFGQLKKIRYTGDDNTEDRKEFTYYGVNEPVNIFDYTKNSLSAPDQVKNPGAMEQSWSEAFYTQKDKFTVLKTLGIRCETNRDFCATHQKYLYIPPVLKQIETVENGVSTVEKFKGYDLFSSQPLHTEYVNSYGDVKINKIRPAYWAAGTSALGPNDVAGDNINMLDAVAGTYEYVRKKGTSTDILTGASATDWSVSGWDITTGYVPEKVYSGNNHNYQYKQADNIKARYNGSETGLAIRSNKYMFKPYRSYVYKSDIDSDGGITGFTEFPFGSATAPAAAWQLVSETGLYDINGSPVQVKNVLNQYATAIMGYNMSYNVGNVSNASANGVVFEGAENSYVKKNNSGETGTTIWLDDKKVTKDFATIYNTPANCVPSPTNYTISSTTRTKVFKFTRPSAYTSNSFMGKLNVTYVNNVTRDLFASVDETGNLQFTSNAGEPFTGFIEVKTIPTESYLLFNPAVVTSITVDNSFTKTGYSLAATTFPSVCNSIPAQSKNYTIPGVECHEVHSGNYAFALVAGKTGTRAKIEKAKLPSGEFGKAYKATVWVHKNSPSASKLVARVLGSDNTTVLSTYSADKNAAFIEAGNWIQLRVDVPASAMTNASAGYLEVYVENPATSGICRYDDLRVLPYFAEMTNTLYEHNTGLVIGSLDAPGFASESVYDSRGRVKTVKTEVQGRGKVIIKKYLYNEQKAQ
jgi:hypothetical protein